MDVWLAWWISAGIYLIFHHVYLKMYQRLNRKQAREYLAKKKLKIAEEETEESDLDNKINQNLI
jgi:beta-lactam-binding protein with PASTA domain